MFQLLRKPFKEAPVFLIETAGNALYAECLFKIAYSGILANVLKNGQKLLLGRVIRFIFAHKEGMAPGRGKLFLNTDYT